MSIALTWWLHGLDPETRPCRDCGTAIERDPRRSECTDCRRKRDRQRRKTACIECGRAAPFRTDGICHDCALKEAA